VQLAAGGKRDTPHTGATQHTKLVSLHRGTVTVGQGRTGLAIARVEVVLLLIPALLSLQVLVDLARQDAVCTVGAHGTHPVVVVQTGLALGVHIL